MDLRIVLVTFPDADQGWEVGSALVDEGLAVCVNLVPGVGSIFRWKGKVETATEVLALFKIHTGMWDGFCGRLTELHPYDVPEIVALMPEAVSAAYARWVREETEG